MANLLERSSLVLTPTAYNNGEALCIKPDDASGDFQFSRNSAATRVNAQGLVENVQILSSNLVQNGDFSEEGAEEVSNGSFSQEGVQLVTNGDFANWTNDNPDNWTLVNEDANNYVTQDGSFARVVSNDTSSIQIKQTIFTIGKTYKVDLDAVVNSGNVEGLKLNDATAAATIGYVNSTGHHTFYFKAEGTAFVINRKGGGNTDISIDNVSVREVGQDWTLGTGWSIGEDKAVFDGGSDNNLSSASSVTNGKSYKYSFTISDMTTGALSFRLGSASNNDLRITEDGTYSGYAVADGTSILFRAESGFDGSITNISVKEVGQNWNLQTGWQISENKLNCLGSSSQIEASTLLNFDITKKYKLVFTISGVDSGTRSFRVYTQGSNGGVIFSYTSHINGTYEYYYDPSINGTKLAFQTAFNQSTFSIDDVSVIEITDDTNLPRINYENFSYQDALGSELVVNGDFDTDSDWVKGTGWTISGGTANAAIPVASGLTASVGALTIGTTYKLTYTISNYSAGNIVIQAGWQASGASRSANGTYTEYLVCAGDTYVAFLGTSSFIGSIDNVSVKEYSGQEVVPDSGCGSWLFESQSTNLATQSELLNGYWSNSGSTNLISDVISPDGISFSKKVTTTSAGNFKGLLKNESVIWDSKTFTISTFAKKGNTDWLYFYNIGSNNGNNGVWFNLDSGLIGSIGAAWSNVKIETFTNGWYRCSATLSFGAATNYLYILNSDLNNSVFSTLDNYAYIWGTQIEENNISSYIPTSGSTVTRNQDVCNNGGSLATINSTEGVLYAEIAINPNDDGSFRLISMTDASDSVRIGFGKKDNEAKWFIKILIGALNITSQVINFQEGFQKIAIRYKSGDSGVYINGTKVITDTSNYVNTLIIDNVSFNFTGLAYPFFGKTKAVAVWKEALSDQELADLTYPTPTDPTFSLDFDTIAEQFTFARGSEATYVDAQGLIQSTNEIGSEELVVNGDFATDSDWVHRTSNSVISNGTLSWSGTQTIADDVYQQKTGYVGKLVKMTITISSYTQGSVFLRTGSSQSPTSHSSVGTFTETLEWVGNDYIYVKASSDFIGSIDNVSVKEVISATNTPRLDYSTGAEAFLLEPQSTNLIPYSEDFSQWTKSNADLINTTTSTIISPDGVNYANKLYPIGSNTGSYIRQAAAANCFSIFIKKGERRWVLIYGGFANSNVWFNSENGLLGTVKSEATATVENFNNGWYRLKIFWTQNSTQVRIYSTDADNTTQSTGNGTDGVYIWGAQIEAQSYATSYIPSAGSQTTRNQETCINATPEINSEEGVLYAEISALANSGTYRSVSLSDGTNTNRVNLTYSTASNLLLGFINVNGVNTSFTFTVNPITDFVKCALKYKNNDCSLWVNGVEISNSTSQIAFPINTLTKLSFTSGSSSSNFFGNTKDVQVYTKALSDAELIKLTTI